MKRIYQVPRITLTLLQPEEWICASGVSGQLSYNSRAQTEMEISSKKFDVVWFSEDEIE